MKILFYAHDNSWKYNSLSSILTSLGKVYSVGMCDSTVNVVDVMNFKPDVIFHNKPDVENFPYNGKCISINVNDINPLSSFSMKNKSFKNHISPYCSYSQWNKNKFSKKYESKSIYLGNPFIFQKALKPLIKEESLGFKFLANEAIPIPNYCGAYLPNEESLFYHGSKASLLMEEDIGRYREILMAEGNPVSYNGKEEEFLGEIWECIWGKRPDKNLRKEVIENHTDYDRLCQIFNTVGLKKVASSIKELKTRKINENNDLC